MDNNRQPLIFISYRRIDSAPAARLLSGDLRAIFGLGSVFIDTNDIRIGTEWPARIDERLQAASVLLAVIGPTWLRVADEAGRRRLDKPDDWVRTEIAHAIDNKLVIIPFLVAGTSFPDKKALPKRIARLADQQAIKVGYESWDNMLIWPVYGTLLGISVALAWDKFVDMSIKLMNRFAYLSMKSGQAWKLAL